MPFEDQDVDQLIAPYKSAADRLRQPYPMLGGQGGHFALQHPLLAGGINTALMNMAFTPGAQGAEGVGGGISRALQGVLGASQYKRQQEMMAQMLPYQMLAPRLEAEDKLAQIKERGAHAKYFGDVTDIKEQQLDINQQKADISQQRADQAKYGRTFSTAEERMAHVLHPFKDPQNPTIEEQRAVVDEWKELKKDTHNPPQGSYEERIENMRRSDDPKVAAEGERRRQDFLETRAIEAGGKARATHEATQPFADETALVARENKNKYDDLPMQDPSSKYMESFKGMPGADTFPGMAEYQADKKKYQGIKASRDQEFEQYAASSAPSQGVTRAEYMKNREKYPPKNQSRTDLPSGDTRPSTPKNSGTAWTPKQ